MGELVPVRTADRDGNIGPLMWLNPLHIVAIVRSGNNAMCVYPHNGPAHWVYAPDLEPHLAHLETPPE